MRTAFLLKSIIIFSFLNVCFLTYGKISYSKPLCEVNLNEVNKVYIFNQEIEKAAYCTYPFDDLLIKI